MPSNIHHFLVETINILCPSWFEKYYIFIVYRNVGNRMPRPTPSSYLTGVPIG